MEEKKEEKKEDKKFIEREWTNEIEGHLDDDGFFITPNGSFWDPDYVYFNREGFDKHGGRYDEKGEYIPGEGWDDNLNCYESEKEESLNDDDDDDDDDDKEEGNNIDCGYTEEAMLAELAQFDDEDDLFEGKDLIKNDPNIEIETVVQNENENDKNENTEDNQNKINDNNNKDINGNELDERESDEDEEIEDDEVQDSKKEDNKEKKEPISIQLEKNKKTFVVTTVNGGQFVIDRDEDKGKKEEKPNNDNNFNKNNDNRDNYFHKDRKYYNNNYNKNYNNNYYYNNKNKYRKKDKIYNKFDD